MRLVLLPLALLAGCSDWDSLSTTFNTDTACVAFVVAGDTHTCARLADGSLTCWGDNRFGQLGTGDTQKRATAKVALNGLGATRVFLPTGTGDVTSDQAAFGCAVTTDNRLSCWGDNRFGQLGSGDQTGRPTPFVVELEGEVSKAANGAGHTCAELVDGKLFCWGRNTAGQLGTGDKAAHPTPTAVAMPVTVERLAAGAAFTCVRGTDGSLYCFGSNEYGQLGLGNNDPQTKPTKVTGIGGPIVRLTAGAGHACAFTTDGIVSCWGDNREGQLGTGDRTQRSSPIKIDEKGLGAVTQIYAGGTHTCAQRTDGSLWCWGSNRFGQLGTGDTEPKLTPTQVAPDVLGNNVAAAYTGGAHTCAVKTDASVYCWGNNQYGQLGVDVGPLATAPVRVRPPCQ